MPRKLNFNSKNYKTTIQFGPGPAIEFKMNLKTYEENAQYRKEKGIDVYDGDVLVGKCKRYHRTWMCYLKANFISVSFSEFKKGNMLPMFKNDDKTKTLNQYSKDHNLNLPVFNRIETHNGITYYSWEFNGKGFFIRDKVHNEIKRVAKSVNEYYANKQLSTNSSDSDSVLPNSNSTDE